MAAAFIVILIPLLYFLFRLTIKLTLPGKPYVIKIVNNGLLLSIAIFGMSRFSMSSASKLSSSVDSYQKIESEIEKINTNETWPAFTIKDSKKSFYAKTLLVEKIGKDIQSLTNNAPVVIFYNKKDESKTTIPLSAIKLENGGGFMLSDRLQLNKSEGKASLVFSLCFLSFAAYFVIRLMRIFKNEVPRKNKDEDTNTLL